MQAQVEFLVAAVQPRRAHHGRRRSGRPRTPARTQILAITGRVGAMNDNASGADAAGPTDAELRAHHALVPSDNSWQRRARLLQAQWRDRRGYPIGPWSDRPNDIRVLGSRLPLPDARAHGWNWLTPTIATQVEQALVHAQRGALISQKRLFGDLLSSQPLAFNAFGELAANHDLATAVWQRLIRPDVTVTDVCFEWSPGRGDPGFTGTRSAFDVLIAYRLPGGSPGFTGIEVKYHEDLAQPPTPGTQPNARCVELTRDVFPGADVAALWRPPVWQLWLDDLLARSLVTAGKYAAGEFVVLAPSGNAACTAAVAAYNALIAPASVRLVTLEEYVAAVGAVTDAAWVADLAERYLGAPTSG